ncbi:NDP-hexose 2,3-dehydratase family protein [Dactylosporangium roseum]|uniref:NDP-hexose 2,3-dehydratase family protein n=1 Tax=Dactylosporangium roseum TaxID=47989 RepID=A0ABY5YYG7_9ACTN|nr:NDP-hexose 2,3-dehydratase family protein [Dactylosporangium roseum]UWZ34794.1 NDP-hexose 2,3-dehydratase family protein [Dactylosporangium roseum]
MPVSHVQDDRQAFLDWFAERSLATGCEVEWVGLDDLKEWRSDPVTGDLTHASGRFFAVEGLHVRTSYGTVPEWSQPIIRQTEIGILGMLVKDVSGRLFGLVQAKAEPGNVNTIQVSPTVQATRSNYTQVHQGHRTKHLEHFTRSRERVTLVDVLQSEQGSWFYGKRNRNMVVRATRDVPEDDNHRWVPVEELRRLLRTDCLVNMDTRTVLACLPYSLPSDRPYPDGADVLSALVRSLLPGGRTRHSLEELLSWLTEAKNRHELVTRRASLDGLAGWRRTPDTISHEDGRHFSIVGVRVRASEREIVTWDQPMLYPHGMGVVAFLAKVIDGVAHLLVHARFQAGLLDRVEMGPTVQCNPSNHAGPQPLFLNEVLNAPADRILFDTVQAEEGGRFYRSENRYLIVDAGDDFPDEVPGEYCWVTAGQVTSLLKHGYYVNIEARSLIACVQSLW